MGPQGDGLASAVIAVVHATAWLEMRPRWDHPRWHPGQRESGVRCCFGLIAGGWCLPFLSRHSPGSEQEHVGERLGDLPWAPLYQGVPVGIDRLLYIKACAMASMHFPTRRDPFLLEGDDQFVYEHQFLPLAGQGACRARGSRSGV